MQSCKKGFNFVGHDVNMISSSHKPLSMKRVIGFKLNRKNKMDRNFTPLTDAKIHTKS